MAKRMLKGYPLLPTEQLTAELRQHGILKTDVEWTELVGGRSNRVWRLKANHGLDLCVKLYSAHNWDNPLFPNDPTLEYACLKDLAGYGLCPTPVAFMETSLGQCLVYEHIAGEMLSDQFDLIAKSLSVLHQIPKIDGLRIASVGSKQIGTDGLSILERCETPFKDELLSRKPKTTVEPLASRQMIHGDPVPANVIVSDGVAKLIDWQCPAFGDPAEDLSHFLSPAMQWLYRKSTLSDVEAFAFIDMYSECNAAFDKKRFSEIRDWYSWRIAAYCLWQMERGNEAYERALELELKSLEKPHAKRA